MKAFNILKNLIETGYSLYPVYFDTDEGVKKSESSFIENNKIYFSVEENEENYSQDLGDVFLDLSLNENKDILFVGVYFHKEFLYDGLYIDDEKIVFSFQKNKLTYIFE